MIDATTHQEVDGRITGESAARHAAASARASVGEAAGRAEAIIKAHPYFTAGILAGIGLTIGGGLLLRSRRRRTILDIAMGWF